MKTVKIIFISLVVLILLVGGYYIFGSYSEGSRAGTIVKLSRRGVLVKTYEGQLNLGGFSGETGSPASSLWDFSVSSGQEDVIRQLEEASLNGKRVKLYYKEKFFQLSWRGDTKYFVYKVESGPQL
ncbi:hypothetical protein Q0590_22915 [Rhodocytophaga aerolata]|uniref:6-phosphogluconate dehydrogenase n=1 Tax=Rhodocytophaga aerolata TaxID=455078 RepID=A0ABT8RAL7_9BACT|nr:hypothetical protein [Rhodocytophaga aerolata]MDO1449147.1 hypothetical protein [Rhodocytophaga aerolata]